VFSRSLEERCSGLRDRDGLVRMRDLLSNFGRRIGMQDAPATGVIWSRWRDIVGPQIADHAEPSSLKDGVLRVRADSPAWATEIGYMGATIASAANREAGRQMVLRVVVWTGPRPPGSESQAASKVTGIAMRESQKRPAPDDPREAFDAAHEAWRRRRQKRSP
jgi:predicted nucleic acid-binding Zn ribbon protein